MAALTQEINYDQGTTKILMLTLEQLTDPTQAEDATTNPIIAIDLTNYDVRMMVRDTYSSGAIRFNANVSNGKVTLTDAVNGKATITILPTDFETGIKFDDGSYTGVYDIEIQSATGIVTRMVQGNFNISQEVTR